MESKNGEDIEFHLQVLDHAEEILPKLKAVRAFFESDDVYTDVLFYIYPNHRYSAIVRPEFYAEFVLQLMKHRLLKRVEWIG
ncbi:hypothetical protein [Paenibacillus catalpae]|uniref:hypothetical protein n=1 Tax=Paenibacillus catalpae TaxID=1045775 RepID=UPI000B89CA19|nr:hypothetical protein [Paenibacillus catalpae]